MNSKASLDVLPDPVIWNKLTKCHLRFILIRALQLYFVALQLYDIVQLFLILHDFPRVILYFN